MRPFFYNVSVRSATLLTDICDVLPVLEVFDAATLEAPLDLSPCVPGGLVRRVVLEIVSHGVGDGFVGVVFEHESRNGSPDLHHKDEGEEGSVDVKHAVVLGAHPAAAEERHQHDDPTWRRWKKRIIYQQLLEIVPHHPPATMRTTEEWKTFSSMNPSSWPTLR